MPETFKATVITATKREGAYGPYLQLELQNDKLQSSVNYRIPKALTGNGQMDRLLAALETLDVAIDKIVGKTFEWQRQALTGPMKGNPRHYPVRHVTT
jgi:hypothetical protein